MSYEARDIQQEHRWYQEWHDHFHGDIVPLIVFDNGKIIVDGFDVREIDRALKKRGIRPKTRK
ncbi:hypothetical protein [Trichlorobacter lovleyi]|uniref:hypothetical protein n=1 Tax=Trichlorobacter lovleyi TaxID=313985 RepID=UPI003A100164